MTRNEARSESGWKAFDMWATVVVPLLVVVLALGLWKSGYGAGTKSCCGAVSPAVAASPTAGVPAPIPSTSAPVAAPAAPAIDCATIVKGIAVGFAVNRADLTDEGKRALDQTITCLGAGKFEVAGHTDADGDSARNQRLSLARARAVVRYLTSRRVPASSLTAAGDGAMQPIADNSTPEGKAQNRRIVFTAKP